MSTITPAVTYRRTKTGEWVVYGPADLIHAGQVTIVSTKAGTRKQERVARVGKTFTVDGIAMVYGYLAAAETPTRSSHFGHSHRKACITGGNCSSFGAGRSCGGYDCDGF